jgi:hypothetical protein
MITLIRHHTAQQTARRHGSCGGLEAIEVTNDPRVTTTVMLNSGILSRPMGMRSRVARGTVMGMVVRHGMG